MNTPLPQYFLAGFDEYSHEYSHENTPGHAEIVVTSNVDTTLVEEEEVFNDMQWLRERESLKM